MTVGTHRQPLILEGPCLAPGLQSEQEVPTFYPFPVLCWSPRAGHAHKVVQKRPAVLAPACHRSLPSARPCAHRQ